MVMIYRDEMSQGQFSGEDTDRIRFLEQEKHTTG